MLPFAARPRLLPPVGEDDDAREKPDSAPLLGDPYGLSAGVGRNAPNRRADVMRVEGLLSKTGRLDTTPTGGPTGYPGMRLVESLTGLQKDHGLTVDGRALPGGETMGALRTEDVALGGQAKPAVRPAVYRPGQSSATQHPFRQQAQSPGTVSTGKALVNVPSLLHLAAAEWPQPEPPEIKQERREQLARENEPGRIDKIVQPELQQRRDDALAIRDLKRLIDERAGKPESEPKDETDVVFALADGLNIRKEAVQRAGPEILGTLIEIAKLPYLTTDQERDHVFKMIDQWDHREFGNLAHQLKKAANHQVGQPNPLPASMNEEQLRAAIETRKRELLLLGLLSAGTGIIPGVGTLTKILAPAGIAGAIAGYAGNTPYQRELDRRKAGHVGPEGIERPSKRH